MGAGQKEVIVKRVQRRESYRVEDFLMVQEYIQLSVVSNHVLQNPLELLSVF